jgi:hypothetical protein
MLVIRRGGVVSAVTAKVKPKLAETATAGVDTK